jgi:uncharacterized protein YndB with AHSA1/START domain
MSAGTTNRGRAHEPIVFSQPGAAENRVSRIFRAPLERVFRLFTDPATVPYVYAADPSTVTIEKLDFRKGGQYSFRVKMDDGSSMRFHGEYREIDPPRRVVNSFEVDAMPGAVAIETDEFEPVGDFTRVTVHWVYHRPEDRDKMWGPEVERAITTMWENVDALLEKGWPEAIGAKA